MIEADKTVTAAADAVLTEFAQFRQPPQGTSAAALATDSRNRARTARLLDKFTAVELYRRFAARKWRTERSPADAGQVKRIRSVAEKLRGDH